MRNVIFFYFIFFIGVSCENKSGSKPIVKPTEKEVEINYEGESVYLADLGVTCVIPNEFNMMDTTELRIYIDKLSEKMTDPKLQFILNSFNEFLENPEDMTLFLDTLNPYNTLMFFGARYEELDEFFLDRMDESTIQASNTVNDLGVRTVLLEKEIVESEKLKYGKIVRLYTADSNQWYVNYYIISGKKMTLVIISRTDKSHGFEEILKSIKMDF